MSVNAENIERQEEIPLRDLHHCHDRIRSLFVKYDANRDGFIELSEFIQIIESKEYQKDLPKRMVKQIYKKADLNKDGKIDYDEFVKMIRNPENEYLFGHLINRYVCYLVPKREDSVDGDYEDQYTCCPPPIGMILISLIILVLFIVDETQRTKTVDGPIASKLVYDPKKKIEIWRFFTYMFVHVGVFHLVVNLAVQVMLGIPLEMVHRWWRILIIYFLGVVAGSLATSITDPTVKLAGASGGVYSLITAHIASIIINWKEMSSAVIQLLIFLIVAVADVGQAIYNRYVLEINEHIGYAAHFAGAFAGLLVGIFVLRNLEESKIERIIKYISLTVFSLFILGAVIWNCLYVDKMPVNSYN